MFGNYCTDTNGELSRIKRKFQGDDIIFNIKLKDKSGVYQDLDSFDNIIVYAYTDPSVISVKGSKTQKVGYVTLNRIDANTYEFVIDSSITTIMKSGIMRLELNFSKNSTNNDLLDGKYNTISVSDAVLYLAESKIKVESQAA